MRGGGGRINVVSQDDVLRRLLKGDAKMPDLFHEFGGVGVYKSVWRLEKWGVVKYSRSSRLVELVDKGWAARRLRL